MKPYLLSTLCMMMLAHMAFSQDWPNLQRFQADNKKILERPLDDQRVVFMGNSITEGWPNHMPEFFENPHFINRGISGQTTPQMLVRFRQDVLDLHPAVVVILAGTNDIAGNTGPSTLEMIMDNIKSMADLAAQNNIKVIISSVLPAFDYPWKPGLRPDQKIPQLNDMLKVYAKESGYIYLDYFSPMANDQNGLQKHLGDDGVHPNRVGYEIMAKLALEAIDKVLPSLKSKK